jgi:hypothetical protein
MKKLLFMSIFLFLTFSHSAEQADYLNTKTNKCVYNLTPFHSKPTGWCFTDRSSGSTKCNKNIKYSRFINGFYINDDGLCVMFEDLQKTGMTYNQYQFQQALLANMLGFFLIFLIGFLFVLQGRR